MRSIRLALLAAVVMLAAPSPARAQDAPTADSASQKLNVYLDCGHLCDFDYFRTDFTAVNWVRNRQSADVQVMVSSDRTGAGGRRYTFSFIGLRHLSGLVDTLRHSTPPSTSSDDVRRELLHVVRVGLVRYIAHVSGVQGVDVNVSTIAADSGSASGTPRRDPWHAWVLSLQTGGYANGEELSSSLNSFSSIEANRVTAAWKTGLSINNSYAESRFTFSDGTRYLDVQRSNGLDASQIKSLTAHWSAGLSGQVSSSTYLNQKLTYMAAPAIEFDLFPYAQSTRRQLRVQYSAGVQHNTYIDTTIYFQAAQVLFPQVLSVAYSTRQPWGSISVGSSWRQYLDWGSKHSLNVNGNTSLNLFKGFQFRVGGGYTQIRDQIYLSNTGYTPEEALLRQRQLATGFQYWFNFGLSYTFGSIYNNVVNPRFGTRGGGIVLID